MSIYDAIVRCYSSLRSIPAVAHRLSIPEPLVMLALGLISESMYQEFSK